MALQNLFPSATTVASASMFSDPSTYGLVQGTAFPDPSTRWRLRGAILNAAETTPMWGGCAVYANVPGGTGAPSLSLGPLVGKATTVSGGSKPIAGWSVFDQAYNMVNSPASTAPQAQPGQSVSYYPLGSLARIVLACDPTLLDLQGGEVFAAGALAWDFNDQLLVPVVTDTVVSGTYVSGTGVGTVTLSTAPGFDVGDSIILSSLTGTGAFASLNGTWEVTGIAGGVVTFQATAGLGAATITGGSLTLGGALSSLPTPLQVLSVQAANCVTVAYNAVTGATNYAYTGACAVVQL
jgi:hypothetical protein